MEKPIPIYKEEKKTETCRVCLKYGSETGKGLSLFDLYNNVYIYEKINYVASIEIEEDDDLPKRICYPCLLELDNACNFKEKCENSDAVLRSSLPPNEPLHRGSPDVSIKEEIADEYIDEDYLDERSNSPSMLQTSLDNALESQHNVFKSKAIDLQLECDDCGGKFKSKCKLRVHWKKVHQPKLLTCELCKKTMKSYKSYHSHMKKQLKSCINASKLRVEGEGRSRIYHCKLCDAHSSRLQTIMTHLVVHTGERPYSCNLCERTFTQHSSVIAHKETFHKVYAQDGTCDQCGKYFKGRISLYRHIKTHSGKQFPCKVCGKVMKSKPILRQHMKRHSGVRSFTCELCAKTFFTSSDLGNHRAKKHEKNKIYTCDLCDYKTINHSCMARHRPRHDENNVACDVCGTFVENLQQLEMHKKRHFEKNFECIYCNKKFYGRKNLSAHVRKKHNRFAVQGSMKPSINNRNKILVKQNPS